MKKINCYHAHIYYGESTFEKASLLANRAKEELGLKIGHLHEKPVGPHPVWSCQILFFEENFKETMQWLMFNRDGLTIFIHPDTGDDLIDHTDYTIWMGEKLKLNLEGF